MPSAKHSGGLLMIRVCFIATGPLHLTVTELSINPSAYQSILESNQGIEVLQWTEMCTNFD